MHIWLIDNWEKYIDLTKDGHRAGLRLKFDAGVDPMVRNFCKEFAKWLRREYFFPIRVPVYIKEVYRIKAKDGSRVVGTFFRPYDYGIEPYVKIAVGDYKDLTEERGSNEAMWAILASIAHELTHYFQYVNQLKLTLIGEERQATIYSKYILMEYDDYLKCVNINLNKRHIWEISDWERYRDFDGTEYKTGLRLSRSRKVNSCIYDIVKNYVEYLNNMYFLPIRITVKLRDTNNLGNKYQFSEIIFNESDDNRKYPEILVSVGKYVRYVSLGNFKDKIVELLFNITYQLTYYYQWINHLNLTDKGKKRQAKKYAEDILKVYLNK